MSSRMRSNKRATNDRRSHHGLTAPRLSLCSNCNEYHLRHNVCQSCGQYRGKQIIAQQEETPVAQTETVEAAE